MKVARIVPLLCIIAACVDASTGTGNQTGGTNTGTSNSDPSGTWNATLYTLTSKADPGTNTDLIVAGYTVTLVITNGGKVTRTVSNSTRTITDTGTMTVTGDSVSWKIAATRLATGTFTRNGNQMTLDLTGTGVVWDFNSDGTDELASLHTLLLTH